MADLLGLYSDVSDPSGEPVAIWERVSTDMTRQEVATQTRDLKAFLTAGSYRVVKVFRFEASAFHGHHEPQLAEMLSDAASGQYKTVISAMSSRYERRGWQNAMLVALQLWQSGARVVAIDDPNFGNMDDLMGGFNTMMKAQSNHDYSKAISDNLNRANRLYDHLPNPAFRGAIPGGYKTVGDTGSKALEPAEETAEAVREAFRDAGTGTSTPVIARRFRAVNERLGERRATAKGRTGYKMPPGVAKLPITADGVAKMLRSPVYSTGRRSWVNEAGETITHRCEPLVTVAVQQAAIAGIESRRTGDNVTPRAARKEDFSGALFCPDDLGRMYRYFGGQRKRKDGTRGPKTRRYVCSKCGKSVNADQADQAVDDTLSRDSFWWLVPVTVDRNAERDRQLAEVQRELRELPSLGLDEETEDSVRAELRQRRKALEAIPDQPLEERAEIKTDDRGRQLTEGDRWSQMTMPVRRDYLLCGALVVTVHAETKGGPVVAEMLRETDFEGNEWEGIITRTREPAQRR